MIKNLKWLPLMFVFVFLLSPFIFPYGWVEGKENDHGPQQLPDPQTTILHEVPILSLSNIDVELTRPDQMFDMVIDEKDPLFKRVRQQLEDQRFGIVFTSDQGKNMFIDAQMGHAQYENGVIHVLDHPLFTRYTEYNTAVLIKSDYQLAKKGQYPDPADNWVAFQTGSDLHEPTTIQFSQFDDKPSVIEPTKVEVQVTDDYGLAGFGEVEVDSKENGSRLIDSLHISDRNFALTEADQGKKIVFLENHEAEKIKLHFKAKSQYGTKSKAIAIEFQPGPAYKASVEIPNQPLKVGEAAKISGQLMDKYGNANPNQSVSIQKVGTTITDTAGTYVITFEVPGDLQTIRITSDNDIILLIADNGQLVENIPIEVIKNYIEQKAEKVLLIRENLAWNYALWEQKLNVESITYDIVNASQLKTLIFDHYDRIVVVNDQKQSLYDVLENRMNALNQWVKNGGILIFEGADMGWTHGEWNIGPGGIGNYLDYNRKNYLIDAHSPFTKNVPDVIYGSYASHNVFVNLPDHAQILMAANAEGTKPTVATFTMGNGFVYVTAQTVEYAVRNNQGAATLWNNVFDYFFMGR
jgi:hypothetical protein